MISAPLIVESDTVNTIGVTPAFSATPAGLSIDSAGTASSFSIVPRPCDLLIGAPLALDKLTKNVSLFSNSRVAVDVDRDGLGKLAGSENERRALAQVVDAGRGRAGRGRVLHRHLLAAGLGERNGEVERGRAAVALGLRNIGNGQEGARRRQNLQRRCADTEFRRSARPTSAKQQRIMHRSAAAGCRPDRRRNSPCRPRVACMGTVNSKRSVGPNGVKPSNPPTSSNKPGVPARARGAIARNRNYGQWRRLTDARAELNVTSVNAAKTPSLRGISEDAQVLDIRAELERIALVNLCDRIPAQIGHVQANLHLRVDAVIELVDHQQRVQRRNHEVAVDVQWIDVQRIGRRSARTVRGRSQTGGSI